MLQRWMASRIFCFIWWNAGNLKAITASDSLQMATPLFDQDLGALRIGNLSKVFAEAR